MWVCLLILLRQDHASGPSNCTETELTRTPKVTISPVWMRFKSPGRSIHCCCFCFESPWRCFDQTILALDGTTLDQGCKPAQVRIRFVRPRAIPLHELNQHGRLLTLAAAVRSLARH